MNRLSWNEKMIFEFNVYVDVVNHVSEVKVFPAGRGQCQPVTGGDKFQRAKKAGRIACGKQVFEGGERSF